LGATPQIPTSFLRVRHSQGTGVEKPTQTIIGGGNLGALKGSCDKKTHPRTLAKGVQATDVVVQA